MTQQTSNVGEMTIGCGVLLAIFAAIVAVVIQANVFHFLVVGSLIGMALGLWGANASPDVKRKEKTKPYKHERYKLEQSLPNLTKKSRNIAKGTSGKHKARLKAETFSRNRTPASSKHKSQETELNQLQEELNKLYVRRDQLMQTIGNSTYRGGKLSKNADYHDTEEQVGFINYRIENLKLALANSQNRSPIGEKSEVQIGSTVIFREDGFQENEELKIVSTPLLNARERNITANSPMGNALMGKHIGDKVIVQTPNGTIRVRIIDVH